MAENNVALVPQERIGEVGEYVVHAPIPSPSPAPGAEDQKPKEVPAAPASDAEEKKPEEAEAVSETPEQIEQKRESRRARSNARKAAALAAAQTEARLLREQLDKLNGQKPVEASDPKEPKREDFQEYEAYLRAVAKFDAAQETSKALKVEREEREKQDRQKSTASGQEKLAKEWTERENTFQKEAKDYIEVVQPFVDEGLGSLSEMARRSIAESEVGPQLLYHLGQNEDVAERIADLPPLQQVKELGKLEGKLPSKPKGKTASDAPPPIKQTPVGRSAAQGYSENMSDAEYKEWRKSNGARWAR